ncbi:MAG: hypothetical protein K0Q95_2206 [Bacteroidota bacterium]|jgi:hypothetical protein|nr:hypothetical protein [Bacteroidota bacterium]
MEFIEKNYKRLILLCGLLFFGFFLFLGWYFFKERVLAFDPSFFTFLMIDQRDYSIALGRWGSVFSQVLPLAALKNGCDLSTFLHLFSIAPIINYLIIFLLLILLKNYRAAIALMLALCLAFRHAFYYTTAELYLGIALSVLLWALIAEPKENSTKSKRILRFVFSLLLIYIMSYLHQLTLFTIAFVLATELIGRKRFKDRYLWIISGITITWFLIRIYILTDTAYENEKIPTMDVFLEQLPNIRYLPSTVYFKLFAKQHFWSMFLVFMAAWYYLFRSRNWLYFLFLPAFSLGFLVLILITYYKGESPLMYENYYTVLGFFAAVAFIFSCDGFLPKSVELSVVVILLIVNCVGIYNAHDILTKRTNYLGRLISYGRKQEHKKFLVSTTNFPWQTSWVEWAVPFETTLFSGLAGPDSVVTVYVTDDINKHDSLINKENIFLGPKWAITWFGSQNLNHDYFHLPSSGYEKLNSYQSDTAFHEEVFGKDNIRLTAVKDKFYSDSDSFVVVPLRIENLSGKKLASIPSGDHPVLLSYHVYNNKGEKLIADGVRTPLEVDIKESYLQGLTVILPKERGEYSVEVDIVSENKRWWGINSKFSLIVR